MAKKKTQKKARPKSAAPSALTGRQPFWVGRPLLIAGLFFCLGFLLYANSLQNEYALDDAIVIEQNEFVQEGVAGFEGILKYDTFRGFFKDPGKDKLVSGGRYRPLTLLMFAVEIELFGEKQAFWGHLINCLFFGLTAFLLYLLIFRMLQPPKGTEFASWVALAATLLFVVHPIHTEAVANIKGRDEILSLLGGLGAMYAVFRLADGGRKAGWLFAAFLALLVGLFSKEHVITLVLIIPLALWYFRKLPVTDLAVNSIPLVLAAAAYLLVRGAILGWELGEPPRELMNNPFLVMMDGRMVDMSFGEKYATIMHTLGMYLKLLVFPHPLTHDYYPRHIEIMSFGDWSVLLSLLLHLGLVIAAIRSLITRSVWGFGIWFYLLSLSIVSNIVFPVGTNMSERFVYLPSVGFCLSVAAILYVFVKPKWKLAGLNRSLIGLGVVAIAFGVLTFLRNPVWKDDQTLFSTDVQVSANSAKVQTSYGGSLIEQADELAQGPERTVLLDQALVHLNKAVEIHPYFKNPWHLMGNAYIYKGSYQQAVQHYERAITLDPGFLEAITNKGLAHMYLNQFAQAFNQFDRALELKPGYPVALRYYGLAYREAGQFYGGATKRYCYSFTLFT